MVELEYQLFDEQNVFQEISPFAFTLYYLDLGSTCVHLENSDARPTRKQNVRANRDR